MNILDQCREMLKHHELHKSSENEYIMYCGNFMREMQVNIGFVDQGGRVVISGDWHPGTNGVISEHGYGKEWFKRKMSPQYMACKFGMGPWDKEEYGKLVAIQEKFSELYAKMEMDREEWGFDE